MFEEITLDQPNPSLKSAVSIRSDFLEEFDDENKKEDKNYIEQESINNLQNDGKLNNILKRQLSNLPGVLTGDVERLMCTFLND